MPARRTIVSVAVAAVAVVVLAIGGARSCGPEEKPVVDDGQRASPRPTASGGSVSYERHSELAVADGLRPQYLEFADAYNGYVLFAGCSQECRGALFVTYDGGQSWVERTLPFERVEAVNFWLVNAETIIVAGQPAGWFRSTDSGRSFVRGGDGEPPPAEYLRGPSLGCVERQQECPRILLIDGRPAPVQPPLAGALRGVERGRDGTVYAVAASGTTVTVAKGPDGGRGWTPLGGPVSVPVADSVSLSVSPDGRDVWLLAHNAEVLAAYLWDGRGWREVKRDIATRARPGGMVALGQGVLAVASSRFSYLHSDGRFHDADRPMNASSVRLLGDGTLMTSTAPSDVWLGTGDAAARVWNRITIDSRWT